MASADITLGSSTCEFEVDTTVRTATLNHRGGWLRNNHATETIYLGINNSAPAVAQPVGEGQVTLKAGVVMQLPAWCTAFKFDAGAQSFLQYSPDPFR